MRLFSSLIWPRFKRVSFLILGLAVFTFLFWGYSFQGNETLTQGDSQEKIVAQSFKIPLYFESNEGQIGASVKYLTRGVGYGLYFSPQEVVLALKKSQEDASTSVLKMQFVGANSDPVIKGMDEQEAKSHYFIGNDSSKWHLNVPNYAKVAYQDLYSGIDAVFYGNGQQLEYDFCVAPGANPQAVRLHMAGAKELTIEQDGSLNVVMEDEQAIQMQKPFIYQIVDGKQVVVAGEFTLLAKSDFGFTIGAYDASKQLIIDPVLSYSTYLANSFGRSIAVGSDGSAYITGLTISKAFPTTAGAFQTASGGLADAIITKFNPAGTALVFSTYLGGSGSDEGHAIAVDSSGAVYITGRTTSSNFPVTAGAFQTASGGITNAFITKLEASGATLSYSTYLGGHGNGINGDEGNGIAIDSSGAAYVTGFTTSSNFPITAGAFQTVLSGIQDAFITKLEADGKALSYSTYLGGSGRETGESIAVDSSGAAFITGLTTSTNFPTTPGAFQLAYGGGLQDAFVTKLEANGAALSYSTYLGGTGSETGHSIAIDSSGAAYVTGLTSSSNFPITAGAFQTVLAGSSDVFVTKFEASGATLSYSTFLGGSGLDSGSSIAVDRGGTAYITGFTTSSNFPTTPGAFQPARAGGFDDAFFTKLKADGSALGYSTYLGGNRFDEGTGIAIDSLGAAYITGTTNSSNFPTTPGAYQTALVGTNNAFVTKIETVLPPRDLKGSQKVNRFASQSDYINVLKWKTPLSGNPPVAYRIYRDSSLKLIAEVPSGRHLKFNDHNRKKGKTYTFFIVSVDQLGDVSAPAIVTIRGRS
jgi:hypothetical protein